MKQATLPDDIARDLEQIQAIEQTDQTATLVRLLKKAIRDWKLEYHAQAYADGKISMARAAQESGVTLWEMLAYVRSRKISAQYDRDDLEEDVNEIYRRFEKLPQH